MKIIKNSMKHITIIIIKKSIKSGNNAKYKFRDNYGRWR